MCFFLIQCLTATATCASMELTSRAVCLHHGCIRMHETCCNKKFLHGYQEPDVALKRRHVVTPTTCVGPVAIKNTPTLKRQRLHRWNSVRGHDAYLHAHVAGTRPIASRATVPGDKELRALGILEWVRVLCFCTKTTIRAHWSSQCV